MIIGFADKATEQVFQERKPAGLPSDILKRALAKLQQLHNSRSLEDLRLPAGNRLESLKGSRAGQHSIRINDQWRICFVWTASNDSAWVEITDYH